MRCCTGDSRARTAPRSRSWIVVVGLILVGGMVGAARVDAASLTLDWAAPTTNADGTQLTDLGSYRIYLGTSSPACPSASFFTVASPTSSPASGQTLSRVVASLTADTTYFARVTAVDTSGNESACSAAASGVAKADFSVTPSTTTSFGSVAVGTTVDRTFTVQNTSTISLSGTASIGAPYSIQTGGSFSLAAGASQTVTVRFRPTSSGTFAGNVNFVAGSDTISRAVTGSGTDSSTSSTPATYTLSVTKNGSGSGMVTGLRHQLWRRLLGVRHRRDTALTLTAAPAAGSTFAGWSGACSGTGSCALTVNAATTVTATFNTTLTPVTTTLTPVTLSVTKSGPGTITSASRWNHQLRRHLLAIRHPRHRIDPHRRSGQWLLLCRLEGGLRWHRVLHPDHQHGHHRDRHVQAAIRAVEIPAVTKYLRCSSESRYRHGGRPPADHPLNTIASARTLSMSSSGFSRTTIRSASLPASIRVL